MSGVFVTSYEVNDIGLPLIERHNAAAKAWLAAAWALTEELGGTGFHPGWNGIRAILFEGDAPSGWRVLEGDPQHREYVRCVPRKTSKAGKELTARLSSVGMRPKGEDAAALFGWAPPEMAMDGSKVYFPTAQTIELPSPRHFIRLPRFAKDGWQGHAGLTEQPESEYMRAIEAHNACVRDRNAKGGAA